MSDVKPLGGTELLYSYLSNALPDLCNDVQIILSRPDAVPLEDKPRILWLHDLPQDPAIASIRDASYRTRFNRIVFVSHWQQQQFAQYAGVPYSDGIVIKNAVPHRMMKPKVRGEKLKFIYTSTPHRGLAVLAAAADALAKIRTDWELHVYSSLKIYGWTEQDAQFTPLYDKLRENPCVVYHGTQPNSVVRDALDDAHVFVYPSTYQETSCLAIQEALMAGCLAITSSLGALPETCGEWAWMFQFDENPEVLAQRTYDMMNFALAQYDNPRLAASLSAQSVYYQQYYSFENRVESWRHLLTHTKNQGVPNQKLVFG